MGSSYMSITYSYKLSRGFPRTIATFFRVGTFLQQHLAASGGMSLRSSSSTNSHLVNCFSLLISLFPFSKLHHLVHTIELKVFELQRKFEILAKGRDIYGLFPPPLLWQFDRDFYNHELQMGHLTSGHLLTGETLEIGLPAQELTLEYLINVRHLLNVHNGKLYLTWLTKWDNLMLLN